MRSTRRDRELDDELRAHLDMAVRDRIARGESPDEAAAAARREFGNVALVREITREMWGWARIERIAQDVRYGFRLLRRSRTFSIVAIATLALGISATSAVFSVLNAVRLRPLPVPRPHELVEITPVDMEGARGNYHNFHANITNPIWEQIRDRQQALRGTLAYGVEEFNLATGGEARIARGLLVSGSYFEVLEIAAERGRVLTRADDYRGCPSRAVISHRFWEQELGGDASVLGRTITLDSMPTEIIGVLPAAFTGLEVGRTFDVAVPICAEAAIHGPAAYLNSGSDWWLVVVGRLKPGVTIGQATAHFQALSSGIFQDTVAANYPPASAPKYLAMKLHAVPASTGVSFLREMYEQSLWVLLAFAFLVLVMTCANLANLMLARASAREAEIALRLGLGASRGRVVLQLLTESIILAAAGAALGLVLAQSFSGGLLAMVNGADAGFVLDVGVDLRVVSFAIALAALTCMLFGIVPALSATRVAVGTVLKRAGRTLTSRESTVMRRGLTVAQVAISLVLLIGALLFTRTLHNLSSVDVGFERNGIVITAMDLRQVTLSEDRRSEYKHDIIVRLRHIPGIEAAAATSVVPLGGSSSGNNITFDTPAGPKTVNMLATRVSDGYFAAFRIPFLSGRDFDPSRDTAQAPNVVIVNQTLASMFDGGRAIGRRFRVEATTTAPVTEFEIIGVVADSKYLDLRQEPYPTVFYPLSQNPRQRPNLLVATRSAMPTAAVTSSITSVIRDIDPQISIGFTVLNDTVEGTIVRERLMATLSSFFGATAGALAVIGLYGLLAYAVVRRTNEIGVRIALGASRPEIVGMILREASTLIGAGLAIGIVLAVALGRYAESLLFGLQPRDPASLAAAVAFLAAIGVLAGYIPARKAANIEPIRALRVE